MAKKGDRDYREDSSCLSHPFAPELLRTKKSLSTRLTPYPRVMQAVAEANGQTPIETTEGTVVLPLSPLPPAPPPSCSLPP